MKIYLRIQLHYDYFCQRSTHPHKNSHAFVLFNLDYLWRGFSPLLLLLTIMEGQGWGRISHPNWSEEEWRNHQFGDPHHQWVGERDFGMMVFCHPNQAKMEASYALSTLHQCDSSEPSVVVVRRYSNTTYMPQGMSHSLYLDVGTLSGCTSSAQFPLDRLCLCWLIPFSRTEVLLPPKEGEQSQEMNPHLPEIMLESVEEKHCPSDPISLSVPMFTSPPHLEEGI